MVFFPWLLFAPGPVRRAHVSHLASSVAQTYCWCLAPSPSLNSLFLMPLLTVHRLRVCSGQHSQRPQHPLCPLLTVYKMSTLGIFLPRHSAGFWIQASDLPACPPLSSCSLAAAAFLSDLLSMSSRLIYCITCPHPPLHMYTDFLNGFTRTLFGLQLP